MTDVYIPLPYSDLMVMSASGCCGGDEYKQVMSLGVAAPTLRGPASGSSSDPEPASDIPLYG
jgi:hypothetical protein